MRPYSELPTFPPPPSYTTEIEHITRFLYQFLRSSAYHMPKARALTRITTIFSYTNSKQSAPHLSTKSRWTWQYSNLPTDWSCVLGPAQCQRLVTSNLGIQVVLNQLRESWIGAFEQLGQGVQLNFQQKVIYCIGHLAISLMFSFSQYPCPL